MGADNQAEKIIDRIERMEQMQAEIKRLTSERNDYEAEGRRHIKTIAELRHEIELLRSQLNAYREPKP